MNTIPMLNLPASTARLRNRLTYAAALTAFVLVAFAARPATAQEARDWRYTVGGGAAVAPNYEGSDRYAVSPIPMIGVSWRDTVSLNTTEGLIVEIDPASKRGFYFRGGIGYWLGRREGVDKDHGDALRGLGNLSGGGVGKIEAGYRHNALRVGVTVARDIANDRDGTTITPNLAYTIFQNRTFNLTGKVSTTWADDNYMKNIFGITQKQAANSLKAYDRFDAKAGFKDVKASLAVSYKLTPSISMLATAEVARLTGDAADSPIVADDTQFMTSLGLLYRF